MEEKIIDQPSYYSILPASVRYDNNLKPNEKLLYSEITALSNKSGVCYASNKYFAELYDVNISTVSRWISHIEILGYIETDIIYKNNTREIEKRIIKIDGIPIDKNVSTYIPKNQEGYRQKNQRGIDKKVKDNNTSNNNTSINNKENIKRKYFENNELNNLFIDFLELRKKLKAQNTDRAINNLLNKLNKYNDETKSQMINNSITNSWKDVYEINKNNCIVYKESDKEWI